MKYPNFLKKNDLIGITALSKGGGDVILEVKRSLNHLKENYKLIVTPNVYESGVTSDIERRIKELNALLKEDIKLLLNIRGGDFLYEVLPFIDYEKIVKKNILVMGYSDITSLLYILTVKYDLMTIYGLNGKSYDSLELEEYQLNNLEILKGHLITQTSFDDKTCSLKGEFTDSGIMIGGCLDVLRYLLGTKYDNTLNFLKKYQKVIWYFDIYNMGSVDLYLTLLQMQELGYFNYSDTFLFGNIMFPNIECDMKYQEVFQKVFPDKNVIYNANIGHVKPVFTIINGSRGKVKYENSKLTLDMELVDEDNS